MAISGIFSKLFSNVKTIQKTIQFSKSGNFIQLKPKLYKESVRFEKNMVLAGDKHEETIIEGLLIIPKNVTVALHDLTISPTTQMYVEGDVVLQNCRFIGGRSDVLITVDNGKLNASNCEFEKAKDMGVSLINNSKAIFEQCTFKKNGKAHIFSESSQVCIEKSELFEAKHGFLLKNQSLLQSRNVHLHHQTSTQVVVDHSKYYDHESVIENGNGMGVHIIQKSEASLQATTIRENTEAQISGVASYLIVRNCNIENGKDVGISIQGQCEGQISNSNIINHKNSSVEVLKQSRLNIVKSSIGDGESHGVKISQESIVNLYEVDIQNHRASQVWLIEKAICSMKKCVIKKGYHVGLCVEHSSSCTIVESDITQNQNSAITVFKSEFTIFRSLVSHNVGNGILAMSNSTVDVDTCRFYNNEMPHIACKSDVKLFIVQCELFNGKSLFIVNDCEITAIDSQFYDSHNVQIEVCDKSTARFENCQVYNGHSYGMKILRNSSCYLIDCQLFRNELSQLVVNDSSLIIKNSEIFDGKRHALYVQNHSEVFIQDCFISKHVQHQIWVDYESTLDIKGVQLTEGALSDLYAQNRSNVYVSDSIIRNNKSRYNVQAVNFSNIEITNTVIENKCGDVYYSENNSFIKQLDC
ncbi:MULTISPECIES: right-handed parallel beta-helix repeat-containing protein [Lysinibacillus]|uniref:Right handed beta helix domain-containing protein n=1 Tax=Lysinibacillus antri TaxID=2498145 RepID=A0A432LBQ4_9BACI|nr:MULTISPECIES: right-handed parallel beta-helix repeat-containing protein [Lysinibacillus]RUL52169.1 hypothetical protein EK386_09975 [Lysinibacillus antri]TSI05254.1 hypothetical protein FJQ64_13175 [Lysinibacillus sp. BW-2-10]